MYDLLYYYDRLESDEVLEIFLKDNVSKDHVISISKSDNINITSAVINGKIFYGTKHLSFSKDKAGNYHIKNRRYSLRGNCTDNELIIEDISGNMEYIIDPNNISFIRKSNIKSVSFFDEQYR